MSAPSPLASHEEPPRAARPHPGGTLNPRRILADFVVYSRAYMRTPEAVFFTLLFPFLLAIMFGLIYSGGSTPSSVPLYVQNFDGDNPVTLGLYHELSATGVFQINNVSTSQGNLSHYMAANSYSNGLVIPPGWGEEVANLTGGHTSGAPAVLTIYTNPADPTTSAIVEGTVAGIVNGLNERGQPPVAAYSATFVSSGGYVPKEIDYEIPGLIGFAVLLNPMFSMVSVSAEYKKEKLFKALSLTPLTKGEWLVSKIIWHWIMAFASTAILFGTGVALFGAHLIVGPLLVPLILFGTLLFVAMGMLVGTVSKKAETAGFIGNLVTFPMMILGGGFFPVELQPTWLQPYAKVWPLYYIIDGIQSVSVFSNPSRTLFDLAVVAIMAVLVFIAAVIAFRWREE